MKFRLMIALAAWLFSCAAFAGSISFQLSLTGATLTVTAKGDSTAFYPAVFRLLADGRCERLAGVSAGLPVAELLPGAHLDFLWPEVRPLDSLPSLERLRPLMVRFFDQAGVSFGQISFMQPPPAASETLPARYADGELTVAPPGGGGIPATWIIWAQEEGIAPIRRAVTFEYVQPPARRIEWHAGMSPLRLATGAAQPPAMLLHETPQGLTLQTVARDIAQGRQQRTGWLDARSWFYGLALLAILLAFAMALLLPIVVRIRQGRRGRVVR
ncbi:MAG: hypothetical protein NTY41_15585 [Proteobacteria bacterium]|nr:hypothetical protein [Pseudomonadota bacterium]